MDFDRLMDYQNLVQRGLMKEQQMDRTIELLTIVNHLTAGPKNLVQKEQVLLEARHHGFSEPETDKLLHQLIRDNIIFEPAPGYLKKRIA